MIKAVLIDLDNTLIRNPDAPFARDYLTLAQTFFQAHGIPDMADRLRKIVTTLGTPHPAHLTNSAQSLAIMSAGTGASPSTTHQLIANFVATDYEELSSLISPMPGADDLLMQLLARSIPLVIATNPLYPLAAIQARMRWGNLSPDLNRFRLITSADHMHFAKPDAAYYAEIIALIGIEPDEALMIGDNPRNDIEAACEAGLHTFFVDPAADRPLANVQETLQGDHWQQGFGLLAPTPAAVMACLRGNIGALLGILEGAAPTIYDRRPAPNEWSVRQIIAHLAQSEPQTQRERLLRILHEENPFLTDPLAPGPDLPVSTPLDDLLTQLKQQRETTLALLKSLTPDQWSRPARHGVFGMTSLLEMADFTARHDRMHINQLCQTIGKCTEDQ